MFRTEDVGVDPTGRGALPNPSGSGDSSIVSLNPYEKVSGQAKLTARLGKGMRLAANLIASREDFVNYDRDLFFFPTARRQQQREAYSAYLKWTHTLSNTTFYEAGVTNNCTTFDEYLYEDPIDTRYREPQFFEFTDPLQHERVQGRRDGQQAVQPGDRARGSASSTSPAQMHPQQPRQGSASRAAITRSTRRRLRRRPERGRPDVRGDAGSSSLDNGSYDRTTPSSSRATSRTRWSSAGSSSTPASASTTSTRTAASSATRAIPTPCSSRTASTINSSSCSRRTRTSPIQELFDALDFTPDEFFKDAETSWQISPPPRRRLPDHGGRRGPLLVRPVLPDPQLRAPLPEPVLPARLRAAPASSGSSGTRTSSPSRRSPARSG